MNVFKYTTRPTKAVSSTDIEECFDSEAEQYSVYLTKDSGEFEWIADFKNKIDADIFARERTKWTLERVY